MVLASQASGQTRISTDGSLGEAVDLSVVTGGVTIPREIGQRSGASLFHSFDQFTLLQGDSATFLVDPSISRIISRVTGGEMTMINGEVNTRNFSTDQFFFGSIDFWMINPAGIAVGPSGAFDIPGSLHLGAADTLLFDDDLSFSANLNYSPVLSSAPPTAFGFINQAPGRIEISETSLTVDDRGDTSLVGGVVTIENAIVRAEQSRQILIVGAEQGEIVSVGRRSTTSDAPALDRQTGVIRIRGNFADSEEVTSQVRIVGSGIIALDAARVEIDGGEVSLNTIDGAVEGDGIRIDGDVLRVVNDGFVRTETTGTADAGNITIAGFSRLTLDRGFRVDQAIGKTVIESETLGLSDVSGNAGDLVLRGDALLLRNRGRLFSNTRGEGNAGRISLDLASLHLENGGQIGSGVLDPDSGPAAKGDGGNIDLTVKERIFISGRADVPTQEGGSLTPEPSGIFSSTEAEEGGLAGSINLSTPRLRLEDNGEIASETFNASNAGALRINADKIILLTSAEITTRVVDPNDPTGVGLPEEAERLELGQAGQIVLRPLTEDAARLVLRSGAEIASDGSAGLASQAGVIDVLSGDVIVGRSSAITTDASTNEGGSITIFGENLVQIDGAITTSIVDGQGDGGRIRIRGEIGVTSSTGVLRANADGIGDGGRVTLATDVFLQNFSGATVEARSAQGAPGAVVFLGSTDASTAETDDLPREFFDRFALVDDFCVAAVTGGSSLVLKPLETPGEVPALFGAIIPYPSALGEKSAGAQVFESAFIHLCKQG